MGAIANAPTLGGDARLKGLHSFTVFVNVESPHIDTTGLRTRVELKLRQNGVAVRDSLPDAFLNLDCVVLQPTDPTVAKLFTYSCYVYVDQGLIRLAPAINRVLGVVWRSRASVSLVGTNNFDGALASDVDDAMSEFLNAWYKANPK